MLGIGTSNPGYTLDLQTGNLNLNTIHFSTGAGSITALAGQVTYAGTSYFSGQTIIPVITGGDTYDFGDGGNINLTGGYGHSDSFVVPSAAGGSIILKGGLANGTGVNTQGSIKFQTSDSITRFIMGSTGNIGIGSTSPGSLLSVSGTAFIGGNLTATGTLAVSGASTLATTTITSLSLIQALAGTNGGTGLSSVTQNQLLIGGAGNTWTQIATSSLGLGNGSFRGLSDTFAAFTANRIPFENSGGSALTDSANLTYDGTNLGLGIGKGIAFGGTRFITASTTNHAVTFGESAGALLDATVGYNVAIGYLALSSATSSSNNVAIGRQALKLLTSGEFNTAIGANALGLVSTGGSNTAIGYRALESNTAAGNTVIGVDAFRGNTGASNVSVGNSNGTVNTSGNGNSLLGSGVLSANKTGNNNIGVGFQALNNQGTSSNNIAIGWRAGYGVSTSDNSNNVLIGYRSGQALTSGSDNTLLGYQSGLSLLSGSNNILIGNYIEAPSQTTDNQLSIGNLLFGTGLNGTGTTTSSGNIGIGINTPISKLDVNGMVTTRGGMLFNGGSGNTNNLMYLVSTTSGAVDASMGFFAAGVGSASTNDGAYFLARGNNFTATPNQRGNMYFIAGSTGSPTASEGAINFATGYSETTRLHIDFTGNIGIGTTTPSAQLTTTGTVRFANFGAGTLQTDANGNLSVSSDERLKDIQGSYTAGLPEVLRLKPILYKWNATSGLERNSVYAGFSAQNVKEFLPDAVGEDKRGFLTLSDRSILAAVVNAIHALWDKVQGIDAKTTENASAIDALKKENDALKARLDTLESKMQITPPATGGSGNNNPAPTPSSTPVSSTDATTTPDAAPPTPALEIIPAPDPVPIPVPSTDPTPAS
jgi:hypothetical protein